LLDYSLTTNILYYLKEIKGTVFIINTLSSKLNKKDDNYKLFLYLAAIY